MTSILDARSLAAIERRLQQRALALARAINAAAQERKRDMPDGLEVSDRKDLAERAERRSLRDTEDLRDRSELRRVHAALARLSRGGFGLCVDCGESIHAHRLVAEPWASRCLRCQEQHEHATAPSAR